MESSPSAYELEGKIKVIEDTRSFPSGFTKREFVVTTEERFPQDIKLECIKEKCDLLNEYQPGDVVKVSFNLRTTAYPMPVVLVGATVNGKPNFMAVA